MKTLPTVAWLAAFLVLAASLAGQHDPAAVAGESGEPYIETVDVNVVNVEVFVSVIDDADQPLGKISLVPRGEIYGAVASFLSIGIDAGSG